MQTCLISQNKNICALVSEVAGPALIVRPPGAILPEADLYIWDFDPDAAAPDFGAKSHAQHIYLVAHKDLQRFDTIVSMDEASVILKPLNRGVLTAFCAAQKEPVRAHKSLRDERDSLLQYALETNLKLQEYDEGRTNFLARALHDFRAPLTAIRGYCELMLEGQLGPLSEEQENLLRRMHNSARRLGRLASGMFELSVEGRVDRTLRLEPAEIENYVYQAVHELMPFFQEKDIALDVRMSPPEQPLMIDAQQIEQVLINLIENSCRFTPKCGEIAIRGYSVSWNPGDRDCDDSAQPPNAYRIDVRDSGSGIEADLIDTIFEQYTSYSGGRDRSGGGLGLAICRMIVETHGGEIWAKPSREGSQFSFILPFQPGKTSILAHRGPEREEWQTASASAR